MAQGGLKDRPEQRDEQLPKAAEMLFKDFPPGSGEWFRPPASGRMPPGLAQVRYRKAARRPRP